MVFRGEPAIEDAVLEVLRDLRAYSNRAERDVTARQTLCHRDDVGHDIPMVDGKPLTGPAKSGHDLVANHQDAVPVAQIPYTLQVAIGRDQDPVRPSYRLQDEAGNGTRPLELNRLFQVAQRLLRAVHFSLRAVIGIEHVHDA